MAFLQQYHFEWWQVLLLIVAFRTSPLFLALATVLVARLVKPDIARIALPLILSRHNSLGSLAIKQRLQGLLRKDANSKEEPPAD